MLIPYSDDAPREGRSPWMNWTLIAINIWAFVAFAMNPDYEEFVKHYGFTAKYFSPITLITAMFLHANFAHIAGNLWFLHLFGDSVENRCGPFKYLFCYMASGIAGSLVQYSFFSDSAVPSIGASGAIAGIMGMNLFFFPGSRVKLFYWVIFFVGTTSVRAIWAIGAWFVIEFISSQMQTIQHMETGVAHLAHAGGFIAGLLFAGILTATRVVRNDGMHLLAYLSGSSPDPRGYYRGRNGVVTQEIEEEERPARYRRTIDAPPDALTTILALLRASRTEDARRAWRKYAFDNHEGVLPAREQLEIALALDKNGDRSAARDAYERLINNYPNEQPFAAEANLALAGMLLAELKENGDHREVPFIESLLQRAARTHPYEARRQLAERWLQAIRGS